MRGCLSRPGIVVICAAGLTAQAADLPIRIQPRQAALYEGEVNIRQALGENEPADMGFKVALLLRAREEGAGQLRVTAVRRAQPREGEEQPLVCFDELAGGAAASLVPGEEAVAEQGETALRLAPYLGFDALPGFAAPEPGAAVEADAEVLLLGVVPLKVPLVTRLLRDGERRTLTRELRQGAQPTFEFQENKSTLTSYSEAFELGPGSSLPARVKKTFTATIKLEAGEVKLERTLTLEAKQVIDGSSPAAAKLEAVDAELRGIGADFATFRDAAAIEKRVGEFEKSAQGTMYELAAPGLKARHEAYKGLGLGKPAADFTLEALDGKQVTFREATKGKVILLTFWGVG